MGCACHRHLTGTKTIFVLIVVSLGVSGGYWYTLGQPDPMQPDEVFELQFGRGSGLNGLDVLRVVSSGEASLEYQVPPEQWHRKEFKIDEKEMAALREAITRMNVWDMATAYHGNVIDGTQWVLLVRENGKAKSVYFDNNFPEAIRSFAQFLDEEIIAPIADPIKATVVPERHYFKHQKVLWDRTR